MWATETLAHARQQLSEAAAGRLRDHPPPPGTERARFPVALVFLRGDRAGAGADLARQAVASWGYWNDDSGRFLDLVFFGWGKDGDQVVFLPRAFLECKDALEATTRWRYGGETDLLLADFEVPLRDGAAAGEGNLSFRTCIPLPVEELIRRGTVGSLDALVQELVNHAKALHGERGEADVWTLSDRIARFRGRDSLWAALRRRFLGEMDRIYEELRPFAVCDLRG